MSVELPPPPQKGLNCTTFRPPPLDGSLCASRLFDWHYEYNKNHPVFLYDDSPGVLKTVHWSELFPAIHRAGHYIRKVFGLTEIDDPNGKPVIAVLANSDTFTALTTIMGLMRIEVVSFLVSPRNSAVAVAHLLEKTGTKYMLITDDLKNLVNAAVATMQNPPQIAGMPSFGDLFPQDFEDFEPLPVSKKQQLDDPTLIMHSSGSVAFPKPVITTQLGFLISGALPYYGERDLTGVVLASHAVPVFHGMGVAVMAWMICCGITGASFKPTVPPTLSTPDLVYEGAVATKSDLIFCVPIFVEMWSRNPERVEYLKTIQGVWYAGAPLKKTVGDVLNAQGVGIFQMYASTEAAILTETLPKSTPKDWEYMKFSKHVKAHFIPDGFGAYELVLEATSEYRPSVLNTKINGADAYATNDLFVPHPTTPGYWKAHGRADDQIMHNSGEKTNPGPLEDILNADPHVQAAVIFGAGRFNAGVIIDPRPPYKFDPKEEEKLIEFRNKIWPTVEKSNEFAPQHSRIFKEMIIVSSPAKLFVYTTKLTVRRQAVIIDYDQEIEAVYKTAEDSAQGFTKLPTAWTPESSLEFARSLIGNILKEKVSDDDDIFQHSCDSLQATWIRNSILNALRKSTQINIREIHPTFVYLYPSVSSLGRFITQVTTSGTVPVQKSHVDQMLDMVSKYTKNFSVHTGSGTVVNPTEDVVLITGVTGAIGSNVLAQIVKLPKVSKIFAITRKRATPSIERLKRGLADRGLDPLIVDSSKVVVADGDLTLPSLGLTSQLLDEVRSSVTHIFHIGWRVDFMASLPSYETDIKGLRNLIDLALSSPLPTPPRLIFTSSVAILTNHSRSDSYFREEFVSPEVAVGMGYVESKWISEKILSVASSQTPLQPVIVRAGQISGGVNGCWSPLEWMPAVVQSAALVKCLPSLDQQISLIPLDVAASVIVEVRNSSAELLHLINPKPVAWNAIFRDIASTLKVDLVPYSDWISRLEASETEEVGEPHIAVRLLSFFKAVSKENTEAGGLPRLDVTAARRVSPTLNDENLKPVGLEDVKKWLNYWKSAGLISF